MIKSLSLKHWKSFGSAQLWVDPLTFIIGTNAAGKSNIVDALYFLSVLPTGVRLSDIVLRGGLEGVIERQQNYATLSISLILGTEEFTYDISFRLEGKELLLRKENLSIKYPDGQDKVLYSTDKTERGDNQITARFLKEKRGPRKGIGLKRDVAILAQIPNLDVLKEIKDKAETVANVLKAIFVLDPKPEKMRDYTPLADKLASDGSNIAGMIAGLPDQKKREFEETLTNYVRPLPEKDLDMIWAEPVGRFGTDAMLYCAEEWVDGKKSEFDARSMSDGTLRFIAIVAALLSARPGATIVIEEVDNGLHPSRAGELVVALKQLSESKEIDIICTTHNPVLIDALGPDMVPFISYVSRSEVSGHSEIHLLEDAPQLLKLLANYTPGNIMTKGFLSNATPK